MKRKITLVMILSLLLCSCADSGNTPVTPTAAPTAISTQEPSVNPTTEQSTTAPTVEPTESFDEEAFIAYLEAAGEYSGYPYAYLVFRYKAFSEYDYPGKPFDRSGLVEGYFYALDDGETYLLSTSKVIVYDVTHEYVYYVLPEEPGTLYRTDLHGNHHEVIYESEEGWQITNIFYFGIDSNGTLYLVENHQRILAYDLITRQSEVLVEAYYIGIVTVEGLPYGPSYDAAVEDLLKNGPQLYFKARIKEGDEELSYNYYFWTGTYGIRY